MKLTYYKATDRRCYDGAPCNDLQKEINSIKALEKETEAKGGHCTYFPGEDKWSVWVGNKQMTKMCSEKGDALVEFLK